MNLSSVSPVDFHPTRMGPNICRAGGILRSTILIGIVLGLVSHGLALAPPPINLGPDKREIIESEGKHYLIEWKNGKMTMEELPPPPEGISPRALFHGFLYGGWMWALIILAIMGRWEALAWTFALGLLFLWIEYKLLCVFFDD